ncbi:MAG: hypothetical protein RSD06_01835, partial [Bacilli bacterium]
DGVNIDNVDATTAYFYVNRDATTYASDVINGKYTKVRYNKLNTAGWVTKLGYDSANPFLQMPQEINVNESTKYGDHYWMDTDIGKRIVLFGGDWDSDNKDGLSYFALNYYSNNYSAIVSSRLLKTAL